MADLLRTGRRAIVREAAACPAGRKESQREEPRAEESSSRHAGYSTRKPHLDEQDLRAVPRYRHWLRSGAGNLGRLIACRLFLGVIERRESHRIMPARERRAQKAVREPGVFRQTRAVQIAADDLALHRALRLVLAVIAVPDDHRPKRLRARPEIRHAGVVLQPDEVAVGSVDEEIPHKACLSGPRRHVEDADAGDRRPGLGHVLVTEKLVAAAHREDRRPAFDGLLECGPVLPGEGRADDVLTLALPAADEPDVGPVRGGPR